MPTRSITAAGTVTAGVVVHEASIALVGIASISGTAGTVSKLEKTSLTGVTVLAPDPQIISGGQVALIGVLETTSGGADISPNPLLEKFDTSVRHSDNHILVTFLISSLTIAAKTNMLTNTKSCDVTLFINQTDQVFVSHTEVV